MHVCVQSGLRNLGDVMESRQHHVMAMGWQFLFSGCGTICGGYVGGEYFRPINYHLIIDTVCRRVRNNTVLWNLEVQSVYDFSRALIII